MKAILYLIFNNKDLDIGYKGQTQKFMTKK